MNGQVDKHIQFIESIKRLDSGIVSINKTKGRFILENKYFFVNGHSQS